jgi:gliding motility-associated-like protein
VLTADPTCEGVPFTLTANTNPAVSPTFSWTLNGNPIAGSGATLTNQTSAGLYAVTATLPGCTRTDDFQVTLAQATPGSLNSRYIICDDPANTDPETRTITLDAGSGFISWQWYDEDGNPLGTAQTQEVDMAGNYSVELVNFAICPSTDETVVETECNPKITGPTAFRPDGPVIENKEFGLFTYFISDEDFQIFIFNRWGEMVFESADKDFKWNGGLNNVAGKPVPSGTYSYVVKYKSSYRPERGVQETRGGVVVLR